MPIVEAIAQFNDLAFAHIQALQGAGDLIAQCLVGHGLGGGGGAWVFQGIGEMILLIVDQGASNEIGVSAMLWSSTTRSFVRFAARAISSARGSRPSSW